MSKYIYIVVQQLSFNAEFIDLQVKTAQAAANEEARREILILQ